MTIVVGYVPKPEGRAALERAIAEAKLRSARLVVINTSKGDSYVDSGYASVQEIELLKSRLADAAVDHEVRQLVSGHEPAEEVVSLAEEVGAELVVIGLRHRTAVGKFLLGSTAQRILLDAPCPVPRARRQGRRGRARVGGRSGAARRGATSWLSTDDAAWITGQTIDSEGGFRRST